MRIDEPDYEMANDEERPTGPTCPDCGGSVETEGHAPGCDEEAPMRFELRTHPKRQEIDGLAREIETQDGHLRLTSIVLALYELGLADEAADAERGLGMVEAEKVSDYVIRREADVGSLDDLGPEPGTYAYTARLMAGIFPDEDWDAWKDEMKEREL